MNFFILRSEYGEEKMMEYSLEGIWQVELDDGTKGQMTLPGTLDENGIGHKDVAAGNWHPDAALGSVGREPDRGAPIAGRFTRKHTFEGQARISRRLTFIPPAGKRAFLEVERARHLRLFIDGREVPHAVPGTVSTPYVFEVTGLLNGDNEVTLLSDNRYPGWPHDAILFSSAATDETQTNWNGVLGYVRLRVEEPVFLSSVRIYPRGERLTILAEINASEPWSGRLVLECEALEKPAFLDVSVSRRITEVRLEELPLKKGSRRWDEYEGNLYEMKVCLDGQSTRLVTFGIRDFGENGKGRLALNGRTIFLRSEANCGVFPETGHAPMTVEEWLQILKTYKAYGVNCLRFHSHCPPDAAFAAADQAGMMMQPELSHWNPKNALEQEDSFAYYQMEMRQILRTLANHPSFVMLTWGNELWTGKVGHERMSLMIREAKAMDGTRLYANGSNVHYGTAGCDEDSDFYTSQKYYGEPLRGTFAGMPDMPEEKEGEEQAPVQDFSGKVSVKIQGYINNRYPSAKTSYEESMRKLREAYKKPVFSFEVGQFEVLPYFEELEDFHGISEPANLRLIQEKVEKLGLSPVWNRYVEASGELSRIGYREEIEAAMRTKELSGISLLGLQDFPGQGTALVGMLNSHLKPKPFPFARPEAFQAFFRDCLPLVLLEKYTYESGETLRAELLLANYGKTDLQGRPAYELKGEGFFCSGALGEACCPAGELSPAGFLEIPLEVEKAVRLNLTVRLEETTNTYPVWVYPHREPLCPESVYETERLDGKAAGILERGGAVFLAPRAVKEHLPSSIQTQFTTDFWSVGTFPSQEGSMGQLIDETHPIFEDFPTEFHTNWQWWPMASQRAVILPEPWEAIIVEMDSYAYMRPMAQLFECRCGKGRVLFSSLGLQQLQEYPEARALLYSIYRYLGSEKFRPRQEISLEFLRTLAK